MIKNEFNVQHDFFCDFSYHEVDENILMMSESKLKDLDLRS